MGFLDRINATLNNTIKINKKKNNVSNPYFGNDFNNKALDKYNLATDSFTQISPSIDNQYLAMNHPIRFIKKYVNKTTIDNAIKRNPNIARILKENGLETTFKFENVDSIIMSHLIPTSKTAQKLYCNMGHSQSEQTFANLTQAALLHDIGKGFIPSEILNKKGKLTQKEREIIELHNLLSYEILKTTDLAPEVAQLAYEHHNYNNNVKQNHENQALTISDVYCALKEHRPYKKPLSDLCAKTVLYDMGTKGSFDTRYINFLSA